MRELPVISDSMRGYSPLICLPGYDRVTLETWAFRCFQSSSPRADSPGRWTNFEVKNEAGQKLICNSSDWRLLTK